MESTTENLDTLLKKWVVSSPEVVGAVIVSIDGLPIASAFPEDVDKAKISAMTAALLSLAKRSVKEMEEIEFYHIYVKGTQGYVLIIKADSNLILTVSMTNRVKLGLLIQDCTRICKEINSFFQFNEEEEQPKSTIQQPVKSSTYVFPSTFEAISPIIRKDSFKCPICSYNMVRPFWDLCPNCKTDLREIFKQNKKKLEEELEKNKKIKKEKKEREQKQREKERYIEEDEHFMIFEDEDFYGFESPIPSIPSRSIKKFLASIPGGNGVLISSLDGLPLASALPRGVNEWIIVPITTVLFTLAERTAIEMKKGEIEHLFIRASNLLRGSYLIIQKVDNIALLMISLIKDARSSSVLFNLTLANLRRLSATDDFLKRLREYDEDGDVPFPYVFKPPSPPGDLGLVGQPQSRESITKLLLEDEPYCKYCGAELLKGQTICHACGKNVG